MSAGASVAVADLTLAYRGHPAVHHLSGRFTAGSLTALVGPNGAGKSSLLAAIAGRLRPSSGSVEVVPPARSSVAWLPQSAAIDRSFPMRVFDMVALGAWRQLAFLRRLDDAAAARVGDALHVVGLHGFEQRLIGELSAGQFQRVLFARVLVQEAPLILLDEPFNAIDARTTVDLLGVVRRWHGEGRTVIAVLHDLELARAEFPEALLLAREVVAWGPSAAALSAEHLQQARLRAEAWDDAAHWCRQAA